METLKQIHESLTPEQRKEIKEILSDKQIRIAALWHEACGVARTKVIFKEGGRNGNGKEFAYWMDREVYDAIPLMEVATPEDYKKFGRIDRALNLDIYSNQ